MKLIGVSGTNAAGKDSIRAMLVERHSWMPVSLSDLLRDEAKERGLAIERKNLRAISAEWRRKYGLGILVEKAIEKYKKSPKKYPGLEVGSLRNPGEADLVHKYGGVIVWVDADPKIRYERIQSRQRSAEDAKTFEQFLAAERNEMNHLGDEATLNMAGVKERADIFLENNGSDVEKFKDEAEKALKKFLV